MEYSRNGKRLRGLVNRITLWFGEGRAGGRQVGRGWGCPGAGRFAGAGDVGGAGSRRREGLPRLRKSGGRYPAAGRFAQGGDVQGTAAGGGRISKRTQLRESCFWAGRAVRGRLGERISERTQIEAAETGAGLAPGLAVLAGWDSGVWTSPGAGSISDPGWRISKRTHFARRSNCGAWQ
jgi:hypothetical protein